MICQHDQSQPSICQVFRTPATTRPCFPNFAPITTPGAPGATLKIWRQSLLPFQNYEQNTDRQTHEQLYRYRLHRPTDIPNINILQTFLFVFKVHHRLLPLHLTKSFYRNSEIHQYWTRSSENYYLKSITTNTKQFSIKCKSPNMWNSIPVTIRSLNSIKKFKHQIIDSSLLKY